MKHAMKISAALMVLMTLVSYGDAKSPSVPTETGCRKVMVLDGTWQVAEGTMKTMPVRFDHVVPVPGLLDMADPLFLDVGSRKNKDKAFWYRRTFTLDSEVPKVAILKIHKAKYGTQVHVNGKLVGEHSPCFTPGYFDIRKYLKSGKEENELVVRLGTPGALPPTVVWGGDGEKIHYLPGIYDSVELILTGTPRIENVQIVPEIESQTVRIVAALDNSGNAEKVSADCTIREVISRKVVGRKRVKRDAVEVSVYSKTSGKMFQTIDLDIRIPIQNPRLWSPEDPFLYEMELKTDGDSVTKRFGMRSFRLDGVSGQAVLNGKPYYMRGSNICIFRFFEDSERKARPWDREWVRKLHRKFKAMNMNSLRYCIGFPPEFWYDIADEEGILIQDEFPVWGLRASAEYRAEHLATEYREWMRERWNHPCVVIWDAQNETKSKLTGQALMKVRGLDLSNRPWDNGWSAPQHPDDSQESHPYLFIRYVRGEAVPKNGPLSDKLTQIIVPFNGPEDRSGSRRRLNNPIIINEYGWMWLNRDGTPTGLGEGVFKKAFPEADTAEKRRYHYARWLAAMTEYWRAHRKCAGILHFCGLGHSRPKAPRTATSDNFVDVGNLVLEPMFEEYVRDAFAPVGLMVNYWNSKVRGAVDEEVSVFVINDLGGEWKGQVTFRIERDGKLVGSQLSEPCAVPKYGRKILSFRMKIPEKKGLYHIIAELVGTDGKLVKSFRDVVVE